MKRYLSYACLLLSLLLQLSSFAAAALPGGVCELNVVAVLLACIPLMIGTRLVRIVSVMLIVSGLAMAWVDYVRGQQYWRALPKDHRVPSGIRP